MATIRDTAKERHWHSEFGSAQDRLPIVATSVRLSKPRPSKDLLAMHDAPLPSMGCELLVY